MNYLLHYNKLVEKARNRVRSSEAYYEKHHIIPKSEGGSNDEDNMVYLTAKEHFIAHWLLYRIEPEKASRAHSFWRMCRGRGKVSPENWIVVSARAYEEARLAHSKAISKVLKGRKKTPEHVAKVAAANRGMRRTDEARAKMSEAAKKRGIVPQFYRMREKASITAERQRMRVEMVDPNTMLVLQSFNSLTEASQQVNRDKANVSIAIKKGTKCAGYFWRKVS